MPDIFLLIFPSFIAGILTFLAPCTLPLVPAYLGFISGAGAKDFQNTALRPMIRRRVLLNGVFYVLGFSVVFVGLGVFFGVGGVALVEYRDILERIGGAFVLFFGLYFVGVFEKIPALQNFLSLEHRYHLPPAFKPGSATSSFILGATFAFGWTPCVGPILGSVLLLASSTATIGQGALLLGVFSLGLAIPFLLLAVGVGHATQTVRKLSKVLPYISLTGGGLLILLGILLLTGKLGIWLSWSYGLLEFFQPEWLLDYL